MYIEFFIKKVELFQGYEKTYESMYVKWNSFKKDLRIRKSTVDFYTI